MEDENQRGECGWAALERDREEEEEEEAMASCSTELTRSDSGSLSLTANHVFEDLSRVGANAFLGPSVGWTDEMHHAYIRSLEASFINQLHQSIGLYGLPLKGKRHSSTQQPAQCCNSSHQSMVVKNGCWKKESVAHLLESTADSSRDIEKEQAQSSGGFVIRGNSTVYLARNHPKESPPYEPSHE